MKALLTAYLTPEQLERLRAELDVTEGGQLVHRRLLDPAELAAELRGYPILIVGYEQVTAEVMDACPELSLIASIRGGPEANIDIPAATTRGIPVLYTVGRTERAVAEYTFCLMLAVARHVIAGDRLVKDRVLTSDQPWRPTRDVVWRLPPGTPAAERRATLTGVELYGKTLGLLGFGNIGQAVARLGLAFGMEVIVHDPFVEPAFLRERDAEPVSLPELMRRSDFLSLHARVTEQSTGAIGRPELALMKPSAFLVNTARAALLDEDALIETLVARRIAGAGLDVFHREPLPPDYPLLDLDHVITTPHLAGGTREIPDHHSSIVVADVLRFVDGDIPRDHLANPHVLEQLQFRERGARAFRSQRLAV